MRTCARACVYLLCVCLVLPPAHHQQQPLQQPHQLQEGKAPLPAALYLSTPWSDLTNAGDSYTTLAFVDNMIVTYNGTLGGA